MKKFGFVLLLLSIGVHAHANVVPDLAYETGISSITSTIITVSTAPGANGWSGATQIDNPQLVGRVSMEIDNIDTAANLWCLPVSTQPTANNARKIAPGSAWIVNFMDKTRPAWGGVAVKFWCLSDGTAATKACVTQLY